MTLTDAAANGLNAVSLFLVVFLAASGLIWLCWNGRGGPRPARLTYREALGLGAAGGLMVFAALTLAGGDRLVPAAWEVREEADEGDEGDATSKPDPPGDEPIRRERLARLGEALRRYAAGHDGRFPARVEDAQFDPSAGATADRGGTRYVYVPGGVVVDAGRVVAYEPGLFGPERLALFGDGSIRRLPLAAILAASPERGR